jgi:hypothetical protein
MMYLNTDRGVISELAVRLIESEQRRGTNTSTLFTTRSAARLSRRALTRATWTFS